MNEGVILLQKLTFKDIHEEQIIDTRLQKAFQAGSIKDAINIPLAKFEKTSLSLLDPLIPTVFILSENDNDHLNSLATTGQALGFDSIKGYLLAEELPVEHLHRTETLSAKDFLETKKDYILLDVRDQATVTKLAPEKNLVTISIADLAKDYLNLDETKEIFTLCGSGNSATAAASFLNKQGRKSTVIEGGMTAIQKELEAKK